MTRTPQRPHIPETTGAAGASGSAGSPARTALDVLGDIRDLAREARENGDLKTALKGLELEGRHAGLFTDRVQADLSGRLVVAWRQENGQ